MTTGIDLQDFIALVQLPRVPPSVIESRNLSPLVAKGGLAKFSRGLFMRTGACWLILAGALLSSCWGCGSGEGPFLGTTVPVKGKVTFKGKPLTKGEIVFEPDCWPRSARNDPVGRVL